MWFQLALILVAVWVHWPRLGDFLVDTPVGSMSTTYLNYLWDLGHRMEVLYPGSLKNLSIGVDLPEGAVRFLESAGAMYDGGLFQREKHVFLKLLAATGDRRLSLGEFLSAVRSA
jgi:hypothetical protein